MTHAQPATPRRRVVASDDTGALRMAAIDVGSNSLHMIVAQADPDGGVTTLWRLKEMVGLGRISFPSKRLSAHAMDRAIVTLRRFQQEAQRRQCEKVLAVATSAVREAENGGDFLDRCRHELGLPVRIVSAREEARLIYLAVQHVLDLKAGPHLILDIGGGSVEFIVADKDRALLLESRKLGAARMTAQFVRSDPINPRELKRLLAHYDRELTPLIQSIRALKPIRVVGTSGTLENLAAMCGADTTATDGHGQLSAALERKRFSRLVNELLESRSKDRARMRGLDGQRRDQVLAGALLVNELLQRLDIDRIHLCRAALREGILIDYLSRHLPELEIRRTVPDPRRRSVLDLARKCDWFQAHREQVARLTLQLFDQLKALHGLDRRGRELLEYAALLHETGWYIGRKAHHKHSMYLIVHGELKSFAPEEVAIIANIARYHRKAPPSLTHEPFADLSPEARRIVQVGSAILRIADALERSHCQVVSSVRCRVGKDSVKVTIEAKGDTELELWAARRNARYFADLFGRTVTFYPK